MRAVTRTRVALSFIAIFTMVASITWLWIYLSEEATAQPLPRGLLPDLQTVVPKHLQAKTEQGVEMLRFTNGIANRGAGHFRLRPDPFPEEAPSGTVTIDAFQEILAQPCTEPEECAQLVPVTEKLVSTFEFHPDHRHWHVAEAALFEVREARDDGQGGRWGAVVGAVSKKLGRHIGAIQYFSCHDHLTRATA